MDLPKKYRPKSFKTLLGNEEIVDVLSKKIEADDLPHFILLTGPSGCGKTTIGRIIATDLGAYNPKNKSESGLCFREMNTSDYTGVDSIRKIIREMRHFPLGKSGKIVYLLDECHELSRQAKNALLKPLEEAPDHVYFILCTTEPQQLLATIVNRSMHLQVSRLTEKESRKLIRRVCKKENIHISPKVASKVIEVADGTARSVLKLLEEVFELETEKSQMKVLNKKVTYESIEVRELCRAILFRKKWSTIVSMLRDLKDQDAEKIRLAILGYFAKVIMNDKTKQEKLELSYVIMDSFKQPFYNIGFNGVIISCFEALNSVGEYKDQ